MIKHVEQNFASMKVMLGDGRYVGKKRYGLDSWKSCGWCFIIILGWFLACKS